MKEPMHLSSAEFKPATVEARKARGFNSHLPYEPGCLLEEAMKKTLIVAGLMLSALLVFLDGDTPRESKDRYQTATVVSVDKHVSESNDVGGSPSDAPLQAEDYSYDIGIRLNCNIYIGRYESATDYLPSAFSPKHSIEVRLQKHIMYVNLPHSDREVKMGIVGHSRLKQQGCVTN
jgi:hypothetical protein